ncbi:DUF2207 domain-containing protein [Lactobacillus sp. CBA3605]|uniref:DUF2207 domain-containing protein n=1 Tax=Lactobacillus sp. CBA3605 TaxID=2099788 RepID=UPI000CFA8CA5|nr:DUF2207 domain-containing protein [Lactobacillus sp. CBA3605]AVK61119.1 DUF2207 domain-containing protein [Lactobacillus sp. CBA3605]
MRQRKMLWWGLLAGLMVGIMTLNWQPIHALADYRISHYDTQVDIQKDGSAEVTQAMTYDFDDDYHGVFNVQDLRGIQGAQFQGVTTQLNGGMTQTVQAAQTGSDNTYQLTQTNQQFRVKLYRTVKADDQLRVVYRYRLLGVVTNYQDTAELNWKIIGTGWDEPLRQVRLTIQLPAKSVTALQGWTHGPLSGKTVVSQADGRVLITLAYNPANTFVETHLVFPTSVTPTNQRTSTKKRLVAVQKQEAQLARAANAKRQRQRQLYWGLYGLAIGVLVVTIGGYSWWFWRHRATPHVRPVPIPHAFDVPGVSPAVAQSLWRTASPNTDALSAEILQAAAAKEIKLTTLPGKRQPQVQLTRLRSVSNSFLDHCFDQLATAETFELAQLKAFGKRDKKGRLSSWFSQWQQSIDTQVAVYQDAPNYALRHRWLGFATVVTILSVVATGAGWLISPRVLGLTGMISAVITLGSWVLAGINYRKIIINTDAGLELVNQITGFRQMLKDIGHFNTADIGDLILWEQILPYAAAFGLAKQVAAKLELDFGTPALATGLGIYYPLFFVGDGFDFDLSGTLGASFSSALDASNNASSPSGGSGGFSGGSSGGFGGGSGGGAF